MQTPLQVTFRDLTPTDALTAYLQKKTSKLDAFCGKILSCRVVIEDPHRHHHHGRSYRVRIHLTVPGRELVAGSSPPDDRVHQDAYAAIDDAIDDAQRVLRDWMSRRRDTSKRGRPLSAWS